jgi:hypothetical protein
MMEDGWPMAAEVHRLRDRAGETEKITINLGYVDLGPGAGFGRRRLVDSLFQ